MKVEWRMAARQAQVRFIESSNRANVFPVAIEQVDHYSLGPHGGRENLFAEIEIVGLLQALDERVAIEDVDAHAGHKIAAFADDAAGIDPLGLHADDVGFFVGLWLFEEAFDAAAVG